MADKSWKTLSSKTVYKNNWLAVREDQVIRPNGEEGIYGVVERPTSVFIVALTENDEVHLVKLFRYPTQVYSLEIPGGAVIGASPKEIEQSAKRELQEETGLIAKQWRLSGKFQVINGFCNEWGYTYIATHLSQTGKNDQAEEGITEVTVLPFDEVLSFIKSGEITDGQTLAAIMQADLFLHHSK